MLRPRERPQPGPTLALLCAGSTLVACPAHDAEDEPATNADSGATAVGETAAGEASAATDAPAATGETSADADTRGGDDGTDGEGGPSDTTAADTSDDTGARGEGVPMFMATGHMGRTTLSCDEGATWHSDRAFDTDGDVDVCGMVQPVRCYDDATGCQFLQDGACQQVATNCDCDHHPGHGLGIAYGDGAWVATFGWGPAGSVRRSVDGVQWETVLQGTTYGGLAYGDGTFLLGDRDPMISHDGGASWQPTAPADFVAANGETIWNVRRVGFADVDGGRFVIVAASGDNVDILLTEDDGQTWWRPATRPEACLPNTRSILGGNVGGNDALVLLSASGLACTSTDGGGTWSQTTVIPDGYTEADGVWDGEAFQWWDGDQRYRSPDGLTWSSDTMAAALPLGTVAANPHTGRLVAVRGGWTGAWYEGQAFYRSADGLTWETLPAGAFVGSHQLSRMAFGTVDPAVCP